MLIVIKVGTSTILDPTTGKMGSNIPDLVSFVVQLKDNGTKVIIVSSGACAYGYYRMKFSTKPTTLKQKQAAAAIGQIQMMKVYDELFSKHGQEVAQLLINRGDFVSKSRYKNFQNTITELLNWNVTPIVNENDTVATDELRFGDNDTLSAHVAVASGANWVFLLTDVPCLYTSDPRHSPSATPVIAVSNLHSLKNKITTTGAGTKFATGGMTTKIIAAKLAAAAGIHCALVLGTQPRDVAKLLEEADGHFNAAESTEDGILFGSKDGNDCVGTVFRATQVVQSLKIQRKWILSLPCSGDIWVDEGAAIALRNKQSLLAAGVTKVQVKQSGYYYTPPTHLIDLILMNKLHSVYLISIILT
eukprot:GHVR01060507.1.p1 GENE.GHVR01060507.1~~GHVR01060507.1.p1  ORF type:complete len:369 (+),score=84.73 GHVR01060507.1:30-1109(+)